MIVGDASEGFKDYSTIKRVTSDRDLKEEVALLDSWEVIDVHAAIKKITVGHVVWLYNHYHGSGSLQLSAELNAQCEKPDYFKVD